MADLVITAANVTQSGANVEGGTAGVAVTAGQVVYRDATTRKYLLADNNGTPAAARVPRGIALNNAAINQPLSIALAGPVTIGATLTAGTSYWLSDTAGGICPFADVGSGENSVLVGVATSTGVLKIAFVNSGVTL